MRRRKGIRLSKIEKKELNQWGVPAAELGWRFNGYNADFGESTWIKIEKKQEEE